MKRSRPSRPRGLLGVVLVLLAGVVLASPAFAAKDKPNILVIFGDDIGQTNISAYTMGLMGYRTPNIDRIAKEGMICPELRRETPQRPRGGRQDIQGASRRVQSVAIPDRTS